MQLLMTRQLVLMFILLMKWFKYYVSKVFVKKDGEKEFYYLTNNGNFVSRLMNMDDYVVIANIYENYELMGV